MQLNERLLATSRTENQRYQLRLHGQTTKRVAQTSIRATDTTRRNRKRRTKETHQTRATNGALPIRTEIQQDVANFEGLRML